jgi:hypothetical protein
MGTKTEVAIHISKFDPVKCYFDFFVSLQILNCHVTVYILITQTATSACKNTCPENTFFKGMQVVSILLLSHHCDLARTFGFRIQHLGIIMSIILPSLSSCGKLVKRINKKNKEILRKRIIIQQNLDNDSRST